MKSLILSLVLLTIGIVLFILDDCGLSLVDYRISLTIGYAGMLVGIYHLFITRGDETP